MIHTTITIDQQTLFKLDKMCRKQGLSRSRVISALIGKLLSEQSTKIVLFRSIQYQPRMTVYDWHTLHVSLPDEIYEACLDLRKCLKVSVSKLICDAIKRMFESIDKVLSTNSYRYFYQIEIRSCNDSFEIMINRRNKTPPMIVR